MVKVEDKLALNKFVVNEKKPHITIDQKHLTQDQIKTLLAACPATLYRLSPGGELLFDFESCLECGTCRVICQSSPLGLKWNYPETGCGVFYRQG